MEVFTCTIIIGLALDYDVFLFARVVELRKKGYSRCDWIGHPTRSDPAPKIHSFESGLEEFSGTKQTHEKDEWHMQMQAA